MAIYIIIWKYSKYYTILAILWAWLLLSINLSPLAAPHPQGLLLGVGPMPMLIEYGEVLVRWLFFSFLYLVDHDQDHNEHVLGVVFNADSYILQILIQEGLSILYIMTHVHLSGCPSSMSKFVIMSAGSQYPYTKCYDTYPLHSMLSGKRSSRVDRLISFLSYSSCLDNRCALLLAAQCNS